MPKTIYYFPIDGNGEETGEAIPVTVKNGTSDLSKLPKDLAETFEAFGAPDMLHQGRIYPKDGEVFLDALLRMTNGYLRFRSDGSSV